ncbi:hypothetical protein J4E89_009854 [Alternaria sp. Ai002NY15]|nr:hypothetical protein J4E89_009854 [Alternaria sp. Ai002NY15]
MAGPAKKRPKLEAEDWVRRYLISILEYEAAVARLSDKETEAWVSTLKVRLQRARDGLEGWKAKVTEEDFANIATKCYTDRLSRHSKPLAISITDLAKIASTEIMAWEKAIGPELTLRQLQDSERVKKRELEEKRQLHVHSQTFARKAELDSVVEALESDIEAHAPEIKEHQSQVHELCGRAYKSTFAMNRAVESDLDIPGVGKYTPIPAPVTITSAQVKVADLASILEATGKDVEVDAASKDLVPAPRSRTAVVKLDQQLSRLQLCTPQIQYTDVKPIERRQFEIGDIGWFPVLRPSLFVSPSDIHTEFGYICAKNYPVIIVEKLHDCMVGLIINTSGGIGLRKKGPSVRNRSVRISKHPYNAHPDSDWGKSLYPRQVLNVKRSSNYNPRIGAYVDMLNSVMIPHDSRFRKEGNIVEDDILPMQQMRLSALIATSAAGRLKSLDGFCDWMWNWGHKFGVFPKLGEQYRERYQAKVDKERQQQEKVQAEAREKAEAEAKVEAEARSEAKELEEAKKRDEAKKHDEAEEREEVKKREEAKKRQEGRKHEEAKQREDARRRTVLAHAKATWNRMFAPGREDAKIQMDRNVRALTRGASRGPGYGF